MYSGSPAKAEKLWYGLLPKPVGPIGSTCQKPCFALERKSTHSRASFPREPMPYFDGRLLTGSRIPARRFIQDSCVGISFLRISPREGRCI
jgi:hypothetical protein